MRQDNFPGRDFGVIRQGFNARFERFAQPAAILGIDFIGGAEIIAVAALNDEDHGGAMAFAFEADQFLQVFRGALAHGIRKRRGAVEGKRDVFYLNEAATMAAFYTE